MSVQLAKARGARVFGTASGSEHIKLVETQSCDQAIETTRRRGAKITFALVDVCAPTQWAQETQRRSFAVLKKGGFLVAANGGAAARPRRGKRRARLR